MQSLIKGICFKWTKKIRAYHKIEKVLTYQNIWNEDHIRKAEIIFLSLIWCRASVEGTKMVACAESANTLKTNRWKIAGSDWWLIITKPLLDRNTSNVTMIHRHMPAIWRLRWHDAIVVRQDQCVTKPKIWTKPNPKLFSDTKFFRIWYFFLYLIFRFRILYFFRYKILLEP